MTYNDVRSLTKQEIYYHFVTGNDSIWDFASRDPSVWSDYLGEYIIDCSEPEMKMTVQAIYEKAQKQFIRETIDEMFNEPDQLEEFIGYLQDNALLDDDDENPDECVYE